MTQNDSKTNHVRNSMFSFFQLKTGKDRMRISMYLKLNHQVLFVQFLEEQQEYVDEDLDIRALEDGFVS